MNISISLPSQVLGDEEGFMPIATPQQQSFTWMMEWRVFVRILQALCTAYGWTLEFDRSTDGTDASCAIFADTVGAEDVDDTWQQEALFDPPSSTLEVTIAVVLIGSQ